MALHVASKCHVTVSLAMLIATEGMESIKGPDGFNIDNIFSGENTIHEYLP